MDNTGLHPLLHGLVCAAKTMAVMNGYQWLAETTKAAVRRPLSYRNVLEATGGFEPPMGVLQTPALPLGYVALIARPANSMQAQRP
jgi:hypothetical protein